MKQSEHTQSIWAEVEPFCILRRIWTNFWMVLMSAALFALVAYIGTTLLTHPQYSCSATFVLTPRNSSTAYQSGSSVTNSTAGQFASFLSGSMLTSRVKRLGGPEIQDASVSATALKNSNLIQIKTTGSSPQSAYYMCSGILEHYEDYAKLVFSSIILEPVSSPTVPTRAALQPTQKKAMLIAAFLGALAMIALLALLCIISGTVQTITGARNQVDGSLLVTLNHQRKHKTIRSLLEKRKTALLISNPTTSFLYVETIHQLRTQVEHAHRQHGCKVFLVASVGENEGKSTVAANLALSLARRHKKVLMVDCDLRKAAQHLIFEEERDKAYTLTTLLKGDLPIEQLDQALHYRKAENLYFLFASNVQKHSAELLVSDKMRQLLEALRTRFDYIVLDSSPMGFFTDSEVLCDQADASILVVRQDVLPDRIVNDAIDSLNRCKARFLGYVFNDVHSFNLAASLLGGHRYGYGYGYGRGYGYGYGYGGYKNKYYGYGYGKRPNQATETENSEQEAVELATARKKED